MRTPEVSVVLPFRDVEASLAEALESVLAEHIVELELVAIDDLDGTFAYRVSRCGAAGACEVRGRGQLSASERAAVVAALNDPQIKQQLTSVGLEVVANTPEQFAAFQQQEFARWKKVIEVRKITAD